MLAPRCGRRQSHALASLEDAGIEWSWPRRGSEYTLSGRTGEVELSTVFGGSCALQRAAGLAVCIAKFRSRLGLIVRCDMVVNSAA